MPEIVAIHGARGGVGASLCAHALALYAARRSARVLLLETAHAGYGVALQRFRQVEAAALPYLRPRDADTATPLTALLPEREGLWLARANPHLQRSWLTREFTSIIVDGEFAQADIHLWVADASKDARRAIVQIPENSLIVMTAHKRLLLLRPDPLTAQVKQQALCNAPLPASWRRRLAAGKLPRGRAWENYQRQLGQFLEAKASWTGGASNEMGELNGSGNCGD